MNISPTAVANFFLAQASSEGRALTPMQLIKLVYIAHGWNLGYFKESLISEDVVAWKFGPVIDSLYQKMKGCGSGAVPGALPIYPWDGGDKAIPLQTEQLLLSVWNSYGAYSGLQLSTLTHQSNTPWDFIWNQREGKHTRNATIPNDVIQKHYEAKINATSNAPA